MRPRSGFSSPIRERRITLLPVPEPPSRPRISPWCSWKLTPSWTALGPKLLWSPSASRTTGVMGKGLVISILRVDSHDEDLGHEEVADHDEDARGDHHPGRGGAHPLGAALGVEALPAGGHGDEVGKDHGLEHAG